MSGVPLAVLADTSWMTSASCAGQWDLMFPDEERQGDQEWAIAQAKQICAACPVQPDCLDWALHLPSPIKGGVVAGLNERELLIARRPYAQERRTNNAPRCGTGPAYRRHLERGEQCAICLAANAQRKNHGKATG